MQDTLNSYGQIEVGKYRANNNGAGGGTGVQKFRAINHVRHPDYDDSVCCGRDGDDEFYGLSHDYMILVLSGESTLPVIELNTDPTVPRINQEMHVIGFGDTHPDEYRYRTPNRLHEVTVRHISNERCEQISIYPSHLLDDTNMCAIDDGEDACSGDRCGAILAKGWQSSSDDVQVGIVSW